MIRHTILSVTTALAAAALTACTKGDQAGQSADSTARNLTLAPAESTAAMKDVPAVEQVKQTVKPPPKPAEPTTLTLAAGTSVPLAASDSISTRHAKAGDAFTATVSRDVKDAAGRVAIPAGSTVSGTITRADPAPNPHSAGGIDLKVSNVSVRGTSYAIAGSVSGKDTVMQGRGVTTADAAKVGAGAVGGAIVGKLLGKNTKGAVIGGVAGAAAGAVAARESRDIDVVIPKGAAITIKLDKPLTVKRR